jgi:hypothetical protein
LTMDQFFSEMTEIYYGNEEQDIKYIYQMTGFIFPPFLLAQVKKISQFLFVCKTDKFSLFSVFHTLYMNYRCTSML